MAISVADNFLYQGKKPLDARIVFNTLTDMTNMPAAVIYDGCLAYVKSERKYYSYDTNNTADPTLGKWKELETGSGGADNIVEGYFNTTDNLFYEENTYTTAIIGETEKIYIDLPNNKTYRYNGTIFVRLDEETFESIQYDTLPVASADTLGKIVQYTGADTATLEHGHFYECTTDGATYEWTEIDVNDDENQIVQIDTLPSPVVGIVGRIYQYTGTTTSDYTNGHFYQCIEDPDNAGTYIWVAKNVQAGSSGGGSLQTAITASVDVGGIKIGDAYAVGTNYDKLWQDLIDPVQTPILTNPSLSISGGSTLLETGSSVSRNIVLTFDRGSINPAYGTSGYRSGTAIDYALNNGTTQSSNTFTVTVTSSNNEFTGTVNYSAGEQPKNNKGENYSTPLPAGSCNSSKLTYTFVDALWSNTANITTISKMSLVSKSVRQKDFVFPAQTVANPEVFDVPASWTVTNIQVKNDLSGQYDDAVDQFTVTNVTHNDAAGNSVNYKRYTCNLGYDTGARTVRLKWG